ncbi:hypothetical protein [Paenibacillus alkalitolerans]|uniref:hypothetical protein n=1 Tax=Paenibacillus alkalitolerans TaxID=2799335 RepID=UPI0018F47493|nr:hypothetical protein [Paenibacillus alkalitolerans]
MIVANIPVIEPPLWAILERKLIDTMNQAVEPLLQKYVRPNGELMWPPSDNYSSIHALDDTYESFHNWPLFYLLGGDERLLEYSQREFEAITRQFAGYDTGYGYPKVVKEYEPGYDWFHQGEGYIFFYLLCMADPDNAKNRERAIRFAGFYLNEDPEALNYDFELKLIKSPHPGSAGPARHNFDDFVPWTYRDWKEFYGLPFQDVEGVSRLEDIRNAEGAARMGQAIKERMSRGDTPVNLAATSMVANAFCFTGEEKYRLWVKDYVEAWIERTRQNGGIVPDNIGLSGKIGEYIGGKWYGGYYGWTYPHGWHSLGCALVVAGENAALLMKDPAYLDFPRSQIERLMDLGIERDGTLHVPYKHGDAGWYEYDLWIDGVLYEDGAASVPFQKSKSPILWKDGWFEFQPMEPHFMTHVWYMSMDPADKQRLRRLRNYRTRDFERVDYSIKSKKDWGGHDQPWAAYLDGEFTDYPEAILKYNLAQVYYRLEYMRRDRQDPASYKDSYLQARNPVTVEGLVQLTMGAPRIIFNGGLLMARLRYYDAERRRPGLPRDVAALVTALEADRAVVQLVNLNVMEERELIIQAGAFGEHRFTDVKYRIQDGERPIEAVPADMTAFDTVERTERVNGKWLRVKMHPQSQITLDLGMKRFVNDPSYAQPFMNEGTVERGSG